MINNPFTIQNGLVVKGAIEASGSIEVSGSIVADTSRLAPAWKEGTLFWDKANRTYSIYNEHSDISLQLGQEVLTRAVAGEFIQNGEVVYASGSATIGGDYFPVVYKAIADNTGIRSQAVGVATHDINQSTTGYITALGIVHDIDTAGLVEGRAAYLSHTTLGKMVATPPPEPYENVVIGFCIKQGGGNGHVFVNISSQARESRTFVGATQPPSITSLGSGNFMIGTGSVALCNTADGSGTVRNYVLNSASLYLPISEYNYQYIVASYNSGSPVWQLTNNFSDVDSIQTAAIYSVVREVDGTIAYVSWDSPGILLANKLLARVSKTSGIEHESGMGLAESGSGYVTVGGGIVWFGINNVTVPSFNSRVDEMYLLHHSGSSAYSSSLVAQFVGNVYDNGTSLVSMPANRYVVNYFYKSITNNNHVFVTLSQPYKDVAAAQTDQPWTLPDDMLVGNILVGRAMVYTNQTSPTLIESAFTNTFVYSAISEHNSLSELQGGAVGEYYHLTANEYTQLGVSASYAGSASLAQTASYALNVIPLPSGAISSSQQLSNGAAGAFNLSNRVTFGEVTASYLTVGNIHVQTVTSSVVYSSGSNIFGKNETNVHEFTGSVNVSGSFSVAAAAAKFTSSVSVSGSATNGLEIQHAGTKIVSSPYAITYTAPGALYSVEFSGGRLSLKTSTQAPVLITTNNTTRWEFKDLGDFTPAADNTYDIGTSSLRIRSVYAGTSVVSGQITASFLTSPIISASLVSASFVNGVKMSASSSNRIYGFDTSAVKFFDTDSSRGNVIVGLLAGPTLSGSTAGQNNVIIGVEAGFKQSTGPDNVFIGRNTGYNSVTSDGCIGIGRQALNSGTAMVGNIGIGVQTLYALKVGQGNIAIGYAGGGNETARNLELGGSNTIIGAGACSSFTTGSNSVIIGASAGTGLTVANNNTIIGVSTANSITTGQRNTIIGTAITGLASNLSDSVVIGNGNGNIRIFIDSNGYMGLGKTNPSASLDVVGNVMVTGSLHVSSSIVGTASYATSATSASYASGSLIVQSPNGTKWKIVVDNAGALSAYPA
jgi:hypothetical protein